MRSVEYSRDGQQILTSEDDDYSIVWDATKATPSSLTDFHQPGNDAPRDAVFSPDGTAVVSAGTDGTASEWDIGTGNQLLAFAGHSGPINTVASAGRS